MSTRIEYILLPNCHAEPVEALRSRYYLIITTRLRRAQADNFLKYDTT